MKHTLAAFPLAVLMALPVTASADSGPGCGWGQQVFAGQSGLAAHISAATTNGTSLNQLFGLSFDSLGCDGTAVITAEYQRNLYVAGNLDNIARDASRGNGDHLLALAELLDIASQDQAAFYELTQTSYDELFNVAGGDADEFLARLDTALQSEPVLARYSAQ